jgi:hypothetical protein
MELQRLEIRWSGPGWIQIGRIRYKMRLNSWAKGNLSHIDKVRIFRVGIIWSGRILKTIVNIRSYDSNDERLGEDSHVWSWRGDAKPWVGETLRSLIDISYVDCCWWVDDKWDLVREKSDLFIPSRSKLWEWRHCGSIMRVLSINSMKSYSP